VSDAKHTPGPWKFIPEFATIAATEPIEGGSAMKADPMRRIADVRGWGWMQYRPDALEMRQANGLLIAASPRLLAAAEDALALLTIDLESPSVAQREIAELKAAIAAAKGLA
jgi:hypothetical protein